jgi:hypothetical protein
MANNTLTSPDLAVGEQLQIQVVNGDGVVFLTIIGAAGGGGGGTVTDVSGSPPIVITGDPTITPTISITPATDAAAGSMSAADKTKLDAIVDPNLWPYDVPIPAAVAAPMLAQLPATAAGVRSVRMMSQSAFVGSGDPGGDLSLVNGKADAGGVNIWIGTSTVEDTTLCVPPTTNFNGWGKFLFNTPGGVPIFTLGLGTNGVGGGIAGNEISSFGEMGLATEEVGGGPAYIQLGPIVGGARASYRFNTDGDAGGPALGLPRLQLLDTDQSTSAVTGLIGLPWGTSSTGPGMKLINQRDGSNLTDLPIIQRATGQLVFGSFSEISNLWGSDRTTFQLLNTGGVGWNYIATTRHFGINTDPSHTVVQGGNAGLPLGSGRDAFASQTTPGTSASTAANQQIAMLVAPDSTLGVPSVTYYQITLTAVDQVTHEWTCCELKVGVMGLAGVASLATGAQLGPLNVQESNAGLMAGLAPHFVVSGADLNLSIQATPWSANTIHYYVRAAETINQGAF